VWLTGIAAEDQELSLGIDTQHPEPAVYANIDDIDDE
jgi:hypothetical protein